MTKQEQLINKWNDEFKLWNKSENELKSKYKMTAGSIAAIMSDAPKIYPLIKKRYLNILLIVLGFMIFLEFALDDFSFIEAAQSSFLVALIIAYIFARRDKKYFDGREELITKTNLAYNKAYSTLESLVSGGVIELCALDTTTSFRNMTPQIFHDIANDEQMANFNIFREEIRTRNKSNNLFSNVIDSRVADARQNLRNANSALNQIKDNY
jgi:hypothetical protein